MPSRRSTTVRIFVALVFSWASVAAAQQWTLEAVLERARSAAPEVQLAARLVAEAEASRVGQGVPLTNPRLFGDYRRLAVEQPGTPTDPLNGYNLGIDGLVEVSGASFSRLAEASRRVDVAQAELAAERTRAAARAWLAWVEAQLSERRVNSAREAVELQERVELASRERLRAGVAGEPDVTTVAVELASVRIELEEAQRRRDAAHLVLKQVLDLPPDAKLELPRATLEPGPVPEEAALVARALDKRPELAALRARLELLSATDSRLLREAIPRVGFNLGLDAAPASPVFGFVGLAIELPVAQRNQGPRAVTAAQKETERARLETELRRVAREVALARNNYASRVRAHGLLERDALPNARRTQVLVEEGWRAGRFDVFRLTAATRELLRVRREHLETLLAAWGDFIELERASGGLSP